MLALAAAGDGNQKHTKHDKKMFEIGYVVNCTIAVLSSNQEILWEAREIRLTEKNGWFQICQINILHPAMPIILCLLTWLKAHTAPGKVDSVLKLPEWLRAIAQFSQS